MRIAVAASGAGEDDVPFVVEAERLGADSVWLAEAWGYDAFTPLAYLAARTTRIRLATGIAQLGARTPALLAMSAMSMQALSGGRFLLGLGTSGPQVMEGWHGVRFSSPLAMTRETVDILRTVIAGERLVHDGRSTSCRCPRAPAGRSGPWRRRCPCRCTSRRSDRRTCR
jgi:alkanesulfonate monooxygenase SsuD/methylene tetrahydromethanopterin reductase-like flavin-dependent oxidoreductase (luciferase family)